MSDNPVRARTVVVPMMFVAGAVLLGIGIVLLAVLPSTPIQTLPVEKYTGFTGPTQSDFGSPELVVMRFTSFLGITVLSALLIVIATLVRSRGPRPDSRSGWRRR